MSRMRASEAGSSMVELLVATGVSLGVTAAVLGLVHPAQGMFQAQPEITDMHQRLRVAVGSIRRDLLIAGELDVSHNHSGEIAAAVGERPGITYLIPREGAEIT